MKVALGFFGITRSLKFTIETIRENVINPLKRLGYEVKIFIHTYKLDTYKNIRTKEASDNIDNDEYKLLNPDEFIIDNQDEVKERLNMQQYRTHRDPWNTKYNSVDNFILGQYSKLRLTELIKNTKDEFEYILFLRPDVKYLNKITKLFLDKVNINTICIPNFSLYPRKTQGFPMFNDRFAITNKYTYKIYGEVFHKLLEISKDNPLHSETILTKYLTNNGIEYEYIPFIFQRIRIDGSIEPFDKKLKSRKMNSIFTD
uniref:Glycosyltransferase n=1 Tax=viral metagenome TaxID=1070528 RepID=A0A6C0AUQ6_9ZZZZ|tara:strand:+ start:23 stop:796 length:774 start_codon:yes stop_codon:yes gene_type:complete